MREKKRFFFNKLKIIIIIIEKVREKEKKSTRNPVAHARTQGFNITNILYYY
jgi:hypothetical protein